MGLARSLRVVLGARGLLRLFGEEKRGMNAAPTARVGERERRARMDVVMLKLTVDEAVDTRRYLKSAARRAEEDADSPHSVPSDLRRSSSEDARRAKSIARKITLALNGRGD